MASVIGRTDLSGFDIYADHVIMRHDNGGTLSNADIDTAKGAFFDSEVVATLVHLVEGGELQ